MSAVEPIPSLARTSRTPVAHFFANLFTERNECADLQTILHQFKTLQQSDSDGHHKRIAYPTIILTGSEDGIHQNAFALKARIPNCELTVLPGAGHACQMEQPWLFDRFHRLCFTDDDGSPKLNNPPIPNS